MQKAIGTGTEGLDAQDIRDSVQIEVVREHGLPDRVLIECGFDVGSRSEIQLFFIDFHGLNVQHFDRLSTYDYALPESLIAKVPGLDRGGVKLREVSLAIAASAFTGLTT